MASMSALENILELIDTQLTYAGMDVPVRAELIRVVNRAQDEAAHDLGFGPQVDMSVEGGLEDPFGGDLSDYSVDLLASLTMCRLLTLKGDARADRFCNDYARLLSKAMGGRSDDVLPGTALGEVIDGVEADLSLAGVPLPDRRELVRRLNAAQRELARELRIPQLYVTGVPVNAPFLLPEGVRPDVLLQADTLRDNRLVNCLSVEQANQMGVKWERPAYEGEVWWSKTVGDRMLIFDPANPTSSVYPVGFADGDELRLLLVKWPTTLDADPLNLDPLSKELFDGALASDGVELLKSYVVYQYVKSHPLTSQNQALGMQYYNRFQALREQAFNRTNPAFRGSLVRSVWRWRTGDVYERGD